MKDIDKYNSPAGVLQLPLRRTLMTALASAVDAPSTAEMLEGAFFMSSTTMYPLLVGRKDVKTNKMWSSNETGHLVMAVRGRMSMPEEVFG